MSDPKVEEIRERLAKSPFTQFLTSDIRYLLTKLDEAERARAHYQVQMTKAFEDCTAAEERERVLIAGVREALKSAWEYDSRFDWYRNLSRLLPSTPPEDSEPQPGDGPDYHADHASWRQRQKEYLGDEDGKAGDGGE